MIKTWHIVISGFLQDAGEPTGLVKLWARLNELSGPTTAVQLHTWDADWRAIAELIWRLQPAAPPFIRVYAFSWGAGYGAQQLAWELNRRGIEIQVMVLSDPIYRHWYLLGNWRAFLPWIPITVPPNVREVFSFRQTQSMPQGHRLIAHDAKRTLIHEPTDCRCDHSYMDDEPEFHRMAWSVANWKPLPGPGKKRSTSRR